MLLFELKKILDKYNFNFGEISDFEEVYGFMDGTVDENTYIAGSPLVEFRKEVEALMDSTGFEYLLKK